MDKRLNHKYDSLQKLAKTFIGYPCNEKFSYEALFRFMSMPLNNVGDPWGPSNYQMNTHDFEREVITYFAKLYDSAIDYWGYINNGGSEGNLCGLVVARQRYPEGIVYYSRHSHYSVAKAVRLTGVQAVEVPVDSYGEMNYAKLGAAISQHPGKPAIIMANIGTTMTGAIDDVHLIRAGLEAMGVTEYYIHCDGALHGLILPYTQSKKRFTLEHVHSVSISGHKFIGSPIPCGVFLARKEIIDQQKNYIEYIHIHDCTITGSRNAITPLMLWSVLIGKGYADWSQEVKDCLENTQYAVDTLVNHGIRAWANPDSNIVVFPKPRSEMVERWQLACYEGMGHIVVMPHVDKAMIDRFIDEMVE